MDDVTSQRAQQSLGMDGGHSPLYHEPPVKSPSPLGLCNNVYNPGRMSPYGSFNGTPEVMDEGASGAPPFLQPSEPEMTAQNDLDLEILLRGNLLQQQQQRISILEASLSSMCNEIQKYREQLQDLENDKGAAQKSQPKVQSRYWTAEEHHQFLVGLEKYGPRDVKSIAALVGTRNATQVRTHAQKYFLRVARENGEEDAGAEEGKLGRKRVMSERMTLEPSKPTEATRESPELQPQEPQPTHHEDGGFGGGFGAAMGYELGTDFDAPLEISQMGSAGVGGDSPLRAFDEDLSIRGPPLKRLKESFERSSRSVSPAQLEAVGVNDLEEVTEVYEHSTQVAVKH